MTTNPLILDMLGDALSGAVLAAQARLADETIMIRIEAGLCLVERGGEVLVSGLDDTGAIEALAALA